MAGVILETLSNRKLLTLAVTIFLIQLAFFLIGGLIAPAPSNVSVVLGTKCLDTGKHRHKQAWFVSRGEGYCKSVKKLDDPVISEQGITANQIVFTFQFPLPRNNMELDMSRWFQNILTVLQVDVDYSTNTPMSGNAMLTMDARLGFRDKGQENWTEIVRSTEERHLKCEVQQHGRQGFGSIIYTSMLNDPYVSPNPRMAQCFSEDGFSHPHSVKPPLTDSSERWIQYLDKVMDGSYSNIKDLTHAATDKSPMKCDILPFFELGSSHHDFYLVNIRLPVHEGSGMNLDIGEVRDIWLVEIHQNGGFTKVWLSMKTVVFPVLLFILCWFWKRIVQLERTSMLLERTLFALGVVVSLQNLPLEWLTLHFYMPYMMLLGDIRQGLFYAMLLSFWIIFTGEHMMDQIERNRLVMYWKHLSAVIFGCICLFVFEMCERGVQLTNPFYSIWVTETGTTLALAFIILAGLAACLYFLFLCYMIFRVFRNISAKKSALPSMNKARRKYYTGLIYRFRFLMMVTLLAAAVTVIFFIISQVSEGHWKWGDDNRLQYTSAFFTGVYGMWNLYVISLLILYAPSHKHMTVLETEESNEEEVEFTNIQSEASVLTAFAKKAGMD